MLKYILRDLASVFRYLPYGLVAGILVAIVLSVVNDKRVRRKRAPFSVAATTGFFMYVVIILFITFLSRESGSGKGIDLELFSTWGINARNNAYVVENVLLFVPFGFVCAWALKSARRLLICTLYGAAGSMLIELMQLATQRGVFQIDDVLTNTLGTMIGYLLFRCVLNEKRTGRQRVRWGVVLLGMILTAAVALFVFGFASEGTPSSDISDMSLTRYLVQAVQAWLGIDLGRIELAAVLKFFHPLLNKLAHAVEYAAICVALGFGFQMIRRKRARVVNYFYALFFCGVIAVLDELLQQYAFNRAGRVVDVLVDIAGAVIGGCVYVFLSEFLAFLTEEETVEENEGE